LPQSTGGAWANGHPPRPSLSLRALYLPSKLRQRRTWRLSDYDFKAASRDGYGVDWPISYADVAPYYDKVDRLLGLSGVTENLPWLTDSIYQRPMRLNPAEVHMRGRLSEKNGWVVTPFRLGVTTEGSRTTSTVRAASVAAPASGGSAAATSMPPSIADRTDLSGPGHRAAHGAHQYDGAPSAHGCKHRQGDRRGLHRHDEQEGPRGQGQCGRARRGHARVDPHPAAVQVAPAPQRARQFLGAPRAQLVRTRARSARARHLQGSRRRGTQQRGRPAGRLLHSFVTIRWWVAEAYYTSSIGIHDELKYQGNVYIDQFIGTDISSPIGGQKK
jgi:choline dehydrogenase-like flavoprotein